MMMIDLDRLERLANEPVLDMDELITLTYAVPELIAENRELRERVAEYSAELAVLFGVKHDLEQRVRELEAERKQTVNEKMEMWENVRKLAYQRDWLAAWISHNVVGTKEYWIERATKGAENE